VPLAAAMHLTCQKNWHIAENSSRPGPRTQHINDSKGLVSVCVCARRNKVITVPKKKFKKKTVGDGRRIGSACTMGEFNSVWLTEEKQRNNIVKQKQTDMHPTYVQNDTKPKSAPGHVQPWPLQK
jgi:hypothetical protein